MDILKIRRNTFIFTIWTLLYFWWFRWYMLANWDFDIFYAEHWQFIARKWWYGEWVIRGSYYWIFLISLFLCIPVWILILTYLLTRNYGKIREKLFGFRTPKKAEPAKNTHIQVQKKKTYKDIRPKPLAGTPHTIAPVQSMMPADASASSDQRTEPFAENTVADDTFSPFDVPVEGDDLNFEPEQIDPVKEDFVQIMENAGATVISSPALKSKKIDYLAIAKGVLYYVLLDDEKGNWLADEERFNDEDPLWYSEERNRVSPVTVLNDFKKAMQSKLKTLNIKSDGHVILVKTDGLIINCEDMQDIWKDMDVLVARSNVGQPTELPVFAEAFPDKLEAEKVTVVKKIKSIFQ